jgi:hypothetical protein
MTRTKIISGRFSAIALLLCLSASAAADTRIVLPESSVAGVSQAEWSQRWWQWASAFPRDESPVSDRTGARCAAGQSGQVWFLAGAFGAAMVHRRCTVPQGKYIFFPLVNSIVHPTRGVSIPCDAAIEAAGELVDEPEILVAELDGVAFGDLVRHRQKSPDCFDLAARTGTNLEMYPSASDGYYLMLRPLKPGKHTLHFGGQLQSLKQAISYELIVE